MGPTAAFQRDDRPRARVWTTLARTSSGRGDGEQHRLRPILPRLPFADRSAIVQGHAGVYSDGVPA
jgi:hypothetical protein